MLGAKIIIFPSNLIQVIALVQRLGPNYFELYPNCARLAQFILWYQTELERWFMNSATLKWLGIFSQR